MATRMPIAALLARVSRHRVLAHRMGLTSVSVASRDSVISTSRNALAWRRTSATSLGRVSSVAFSTDAMSKKRPSLAITEAFADEGDSEDDEDDDGDDALAADFSFDDDDEEMHADGTDESSAERTNVLHLTEEEQRELAKRLRFAMDRKKQWMQRLADAGAFDTLVKVVVECYAPLYASHPRLAGEKCVLQDAYGDAAAAADAKTKYQPKWYDDQVTKITEQEAMALFVTKHRPDLAIAVFRHREHLATELGTVTITRGDNVLTDDATVDFAKHFRSYYSWAMGASFALDDHAHVFAIYENALEHGVFPTANMTLTYLNSLIAKGEYEAVEALFQQIQTDDRPTNLYMYRQMLFFTNVTGKSKMMETIMTEMKIKGFKIRSEDYLNAIRSLDGEYFRRPAREKKNGEKSDFVLDETYEECLARVADQDVSLVKYKQYVKASAAVIKLFEEMVEDEQLTPHSQHFFPRVIAAATFLQDYDRVTEYVALHETCFAKPLTDSIAIKMVVNTLLLKDEPAAAWEFALRACSAGKDSKGPRDRGKKDAPVAIGNVAEYLASSRDTTSILAFLKALDEKKLLSTAFTTAHSRLLLHTLVRDTATVSNEKLLEMVKEKYWMAFPVGQRSKMLTHFVEDCIAADRWWVVAKAVQQRDRSVMPTIPAKLALYISKKGLEKTTDLERVELVANLARMVDMSALNADSRVVFCCNVVRALHELRHDSSRGLHRQREISRIHDQYLRGKGKSIPHDVREILLHQT